MIFKHKVELYKESFPIHGQFEISSGNELRNKIRASNVSNKPGCYVIYKNSIESHNVIYIGKAGTMKTDGSFKDQGLAGRLCAKQEKMPRPQFFQEIIEKHKISILYFQWFVTFNGQSKILPAKAEADLLQAYFDEYGELPMLNKDI